jgi:hypothetical protein
MQERTCRTCGAVYTCRPNSLRLYCTDRCKGWAHRVPGVIPAPLPTSRTCGHCGVSLAGRQRNAVYCGQLCWQRAKVAAQVKPRVIGPCDVCGEPAKSAASRFCSGRCEQWRRRHPDAEWQQGRTCGHCNVPIDHLNQKAKWCGDTCMGAAASAKRRATLRGLDSEPINRRLVFERDGWRCHLCGERINQRLAHPHPMSASLDHIIPISIPGSPGHVRTNVAASHLTCNLRKHNGGGNEQLLLIG